MPVKDEDVARLSPLGHAHVNFLGRYAITASAPTPRTGTSTWQEVERPVVVFDLGEYQVGSSSAGATAVGRGGG
jgi:hypothetical protein